MEEAIYGYKEYINKRDALRIKYQRLKPYASNPFQEPQYKDELNNIKKTSISQGKSKNFGDAFIEYKVLKESLNFWNDFTNDVSILKYIAEKSNDNKQQNNTHLHKILSILENEDSYFNFKNKLLYAILPVSIENIGWTANATKPIPSSLKLVLKNELLIWHMVAKKLHRINIANKGQVEWIFKDNIKEQKLKVASYIKLLLTFTSDRFNVHLTNFDKTGLNNSFEKAKDHVSKFFTFHMQTINIEREEKSKEVWSKFVTKYQCQMKITSKGTSDFYDEFTVVSFVEASMLFKIKRILQEFKDKDQKIAYNKSMSIIANKKATVEAGKKQAPYVPKTNIHDTKADIERKKKNKKNREVLDSFNNYDNSESIQIKQFCEPTFIDSIIVFYKYLEIRERYKSVFRAKKKGGKT